jgi:molybdopterin molybdotransferase
MNTATTPTRKPLISLDDALAQLLAAAQPLGGAEEVSTFEADGRILAEDVVSALQVPAFDNSAMDGYAVSSGDVMSGVVEMPVTQRIAAGSVGSPLQAATAARIFTGAPMPEGADSVVMQEDCTRLPDAGPAGQEQIRIESVVLPGQHVRRAGEDVQQGDVVLAAGSRLGPAALGLAAGIGRARLMVARKPRVALFSTGDELIMPGTVAPQDMPPGAIYNSNRFFLVSLLRRLGCEVTDLGIVPDDRAATVAALQNAAAGHDLILTSGGVSVGEEDHVKPAVQSLGHLDLWSIAIKPGKPFAYGRVAAAHFIGLPGNPVSSLVTFLLLVRPFVLRLQGVQDVAPRSIAVRADFDWPKADKRREFLRVRRNATDGLDLFSNQSSGVLTSAVWADGLVDIPAGQPVVYGQAVSYIPFSELGA